mgnify:CR=1 FL=1
MKAKEFINKYLIWIILVLGLLLFFYLVRLINANAISVLDNYIYNLIKGFISPKMTPIVKFITEFGNYTVMIPVIILFYLFNKDKSFNRYFTINLVAIFTSNFIVKNIIRRDRPIDINLIIENGFSFPSGHSMVSFAFYGFIIYYVYHTDLKKPLKYGLMALLSFIILLIGLSRIYLGVHYASDVIGGFLLAFIYLVIYIKFIYKREKKANK